MNCVHCMALGYIYCLTSPSGKRYIGQTQREVDERIQEHCNQREYSLVSKAIRKYGIETFKITILKVCEVHELNDWEVSFIQDYGTLCPNGYNIRTGGCQGSLHCEESRKRMSEAKKGCKNHNFGKPRSDTTKQKISQAKAGEKHHFYGKSFTEEHKTNCAVAHRKQSGDKDLPMYLVHVYPRPENYTAEGYAVVNHPRLKNKYFTSKKVSLDEKYQKALEYLNTDKSDAHRLNGTGLLEAPTA